MLAPGGRRMADSPYRLCGTVGCRGLCRTVPGAFGPLCAGRPGVGRVFSWACRFCGGAPGAVWVACAVCAAGGVVCEPPVARTRHRAGAFLPRGLHGAGIWRAEPIYLRAFGPGNAGVLCPHALPRGGGAGPDAFSGGALRLSVGIPARCGGKPAFLGARHNITLYLVEKSRSKRKPEKT